MEKSKTNIVFIPIAALFCMGIILLVIYPYRPNSILSWIVLYLVSFPIVISLEFIGMKLFGNKYVSKLSRPARIFYGVIVLILVALISSIIIFSAVPFLGKWGV